jgi:uncharacterized membrane protein
MAGAEVASPPGSPAIEDPNAYLELVGPRRIQRTLQVGIGLAIGFIGAGLALAEISGNTAEVSPFRVIQPTRALAELAGVSPSSLIFVGLVVMIALPVLRAVLVLPTFARSRDGVFVILSSLLWLTVLLSALLGFTLA